MADQLDRQIKSYIRKLRKISRVDVPRANARVLNVVARRVDSSVVKSVAAETNIKQKDIRKRTFISRSTAKKQRATFTAYGAPVPFIKLLTKNQIAKNIGTGTNKSGVRARGHDFEGAFIQRAKGSTQVFQRVGAARNPIFVADIDIDKHVKKYTPRAAKTIMRRDYRNLLVKELDFRLKKHQKR